MNEVAISEVPHTTFPELRIRERRDLQRLLRDNIEVVAADTRIIAEEFGDWDRSQRRIDLLGVDKDANLVVVELKRDEDGGHMELQAIRYAAMVARMTFEEATDVYARYLSANGNSVDARASLLDFLGWSSPSDGEFARDVRVVLAAADFSPEVTSTVLWLNDKELDITCVRLRPYQVGEQLLLNVEQIVPLPEASDYQIQIKNKAREVRSSAANATERIQFDLTLGDRSLGPLRKRHLIFEVVRYLVERGKSPTELVEASGRGNLWAILPGELQNEEFCRRLLAEHPGFDRRFHMRYFTSDEQLFHLDGNTYALINQWGMQTVPTIEHLIAAFPEEKIVFSEHRAS
jgi:hypothetical protein